MARILIAGGGFGGVIAAETLAARLGGEQEIMLVSLHREFCYSPGLVRLAFGRYNVEDLFYDLEKAMLRHHVKFIQAEVIAVDPDAKCLVAFEGSQERKIPFDFLVFALGRRLAIDRIPGFALHAHHMLGAGEALRLKAAIEAFEDGKILIGACPESRLSVPVYETAFAFDRALRERGSRERVEITVFTPDSAQDALESSIRASLEKHHIELADEFPVDFITGESVRASDGRRLPYDLLIAIPPYCGWFAPGDSLLCDSKGFLQVDDCMRSPQFESIYAVGDAANLPGPKLASMAVLQAEVAAANLISHLAGRLPEARYDHQLSLVIDEGGGDSIFFQQDLLQDADGHIRHGRFWAWAKQVHEKYWTRMHSLKKV
jgi:sulfide:quinone oxidoreductase